MKTILIPTDFSDNARNAFKYAFDLFGEEADYHLLTSYKSPNAGPGGMLVSLDEVLEKEAVKDLRREKQELEKLYPNLKLTTHSVYGSVENAVRRANNKLKTDFVVMGTQGASGLAEVFVGTNTQRVINNIHRPVIAIPENAVFDKMNKIVLAVDLNKISTDCQLHKLVGISKRYQGELLVLHIQTKEGPEIDLGEEVKESGLYECLQQVNHTFHVRRNDSISKGINDFIIEMDADALAVIPHRVGFLANLFKHSYSSEMVFQTKVPLIALHDGTEDS